MLPNGVSVIVGDERYDFSNRYYADTFVRIVERREHEAAYVYRLLTDPRIFRQDDAAD
jgi:hypothetical protein